MTSRTRALIEPLRLISQYGRSEMTVDIYLKHLSPFLTEESMNHSLAVAELMSRMAPKDARDSWYVTGLLHSLVEDPSIWPDDSATIKAAILKRAKVKPDVATCLCNYRRIADPRRWGSLMTALYFADIHTDLSGHILTTEECCSINKGCLRCNECRYAKYNLSESGEESAAEQAIRDLAAELDICEEKRRSEERMKEVKYEHEQQKKQRLAERCS